MGAPLQTSRLRLEPLGPAHADALFRIYTDPAVSQGLLSRARSRNEFDAVFERALSFRDSHGMWALVAREDGAVVGRVGFLPFGEHRRPELAFLLARSAWGRGLATEACSQAVRFALEERPWPEIVAVVRPGNEAARRVVAKLGFAVEGRLLLRGEAALLWQASREQLMARHLEEPG